MNPTPDAALLRLLRNATLHLSAEEICDQLQWAPTQLRERLSELAQSGYLFEEHPLLGIKLAGAPDRLIADDLFPGSALAQIGSRILVFEELASTNDTAALLGREGAPHGLVVFSEKQTSGRGRLGRRWESEPHCGLYFTILLRPEIERQYWANLTTWAAVAMASAIERVVKREAKIKWPNDIYLEGKKAVGILSEAHLDKKNNPFAIVGIGVNVNQTEFPDSIATRATSLRQVAGEKIERRELVKATFEELESRYESIGAKFSDIVGEANCRSFLKGHWVRLEAGTSVVEGVAGELDPNSGGLNILQTNGQTVVVSSGEVTVSRIAMA